ncbi:MAG: hypothetical protein ACRDZT_00120 [Acidimicrobiales bacterium]
MRSLRRASVEAPGSDLSAIDRLDLVDISLVSELEGKTVEVPGLGLHFGSSGMTVRRLNGEQVVEIPWASLKLIATEAGTVTAGLTAKVVLHVETDRKRHRFLVPNVQPDALKTSLGAVSGRFGKTVIAAGAPRRASRAR